MKIDIPELRKKYKFPTGKYDVVYVDFPWEYKNKKTGGSHKSGASQKYNTITTETIIKEVVPLINSITNDDSVLFMWCTVPMWREQLRVFDAMGFTEKTMIFWNKTGRLGMGFWLRQQVEFIIVGIKGSVKAFRSSRRNIIDAPVGKHSEKPKEFRELIDDITSSMNKPKKIELFARSKVKNWKSWGDGVGL